jgi:phosphoglycolate phosphatase
LRKYDCAVFDLDGTLLNTERGIVNGLNDMTDKLGLKQIPPGDRRRFIGPPIEQSVRAYFGLDDRRAEEAAAVFRTVYASRYLFEAVPYHGVAEMLRRLTDGGMRCAIATYKRHDYAVKLTERFGFDKYCRPCLGSDTKELALKEKIILECVKRMGGEASRTLYIGDTEHDRVGAKQAGIDFLGVTYGFGFIPGKESFADTPAQITELIPGKG